MVGRGATLIKPRLLVIRKSTLKTSWRLLIAARVHCMSSGGVLFAYLVRCCLWGFRRVFSFFSYHFPSYPYAGGLFPLFDSDSRNSLSEHGLLFKSAKHRHPNLNFVCFLRNTRANRMHFWIAELGIHSKTLLGLLSMC